MKKANILGRRFAKGVASEDLAQTFIGWAYAHGHDLPRSQEETDALFLVLETINTAPEWQKYRQAFHNMGGGRRAKRWRTVYRAMTRNTTSLVFLTISGRKIQLTDWITTRTHNSLRMPQ